MMRLPTAIEDAVLVVVVCTLAALVAREGVRAAELTAGAPLSAKDLYGALAQKNARVQVIDARTLADYDDAHVPGALPFPGCDAARLPEAAAPRVLGTVPAVVVTDGSADGSTDAAVLARCRAAFTSLRVLAGGMEAWSDANLPEDSGPYTPPKVSAGGGCL